jgi:prenyl protein peptidase
VKLEADKMLLIFTATGSLLLSIFYAVLFVGSLYVWNVLRPDLAHVDRNDTRVIHRRMASVGTVTVLAPVLLFILGSSSASATTSPPFLEWIGVRSAALAKATLSSLFLTALLFAGPLVDLAIGLHLRASNSVSSSSAASMSAAPTQAHRTADKPDNAWLVYFSALVSDVAASLRAAWLADTGEALRNARNLIAGPVCEEVVFRACVLPALLAGGWSPAAAIVVSPVIFGAAHVHHVVGLVRARGATWTQAAATAAFQFTFTTVFGVYVAHLFVRTGHLAAVIVVHTFCNAMGVPSFAFMRPYARAYPYRHLVIAAYVCGIAAFAFSFASLTDASLYASPMWSRTRAVAVE